MDPGHETSRNPKEKIIYSLTVKMYTIEGFIHSDLSSENVTLGKAIPQIYNQKFIYGHLDKTHSRLDSYYIVFLMVWFKIKWT